MHGPKFRWMQGLAGVAAIDAIWQKVDDMNGLINDTILAKRLGYVGKCIIHPTQIEPVHKIFVPSKNEVEWAKKIIESLGPSMEKRSKTGAVRIDGKMIDAGTLQTRKDDIK